MSESTKFIHEDGSWQIEGIHCFPLGLQVETPYGTLEVVSQKLTYDTRDTQMVVYLGKSE